MEKVIDDLPEVMVLKSTGRPGERIATEVGEGIMRILRDFARQRPVEFYHLARLCQRKYFHAAEKALRVYFPGSEAAAPAMLAVFRAALINDSLATRLGSPYDLAASYQGTGKVYDQHLCQIAHWIADLTLETSFDFGNTKDKTWMVDRRSSQPDPEAERAQGLFLYVYCGDFPHSLITPWGRWRFADYTDYTRHTDLQKGDTRLIDIVTKDFDFEQVYDHNRLTILALQSAFGEELPPAKFLPESENATVGYSRYITAIWEHAGKWLNPEQYFSFGRQ